MGGDERQVRHGAQERSDLTGAAAHRHIGKAKIKPAMDDHDEPSIAQGGKVREHARIIKPKVLVVGMELDALEPGGGNLLQMRRIVAGSFDLKLFTPSTKTL